MPKSSKIGRHGPAYRDPILSVATCPKVLVLDGDFVGVVGRVFSETQVQGGNKGTYLAVAIPSEFKGFSYIRHFREEQVRYV